MKTLLRARPNWPIFWNGTPKNIPDRQQCVKYRKSLKSAKSLHPNVCRHLKAQVTNEWGLET